MHHHSPFLNPCSFVAVHLARAASHTVARTRHTPLAAVLSAEQQRGAIRQGRQFGLESRVARVERVTRASARAGALRRAQASRTQAASWRVGDGRRLEHPRCVPRLAPARAGRVDRMRCDQSAECSGWHPARCALAARCSCMVRRSDASFAFGRGRSVDLGRTSSSPEHWPVGLSKPKLCVGIAACRLSSFIILSRDLWDDGLHTFGARGAGPGAVLPTPDSAVVHDTPWP
jgi:hypothetical protein